MTGLPPGATDASRRRFEIARSLAHACPAFLALEIAVTGSVSRGIADDLSDIEVNFWNRELPSIDQWRSWLEGMGATDIAPDSVVNTLDDSRWVTCRFRGIWIEVGWGSTESFDDLIGRIAGGAVIGLGRLQFADIILHAVPLRTAGAIARWKAALEAYPDQLQAAVIADNTSVWSDPHVPGVRWALAARDERFMLATRLSWDMNNILAVLYAINRKWQPDPKWTNLLLRDLAIQPERLPERINAIFTFHDLRACIVECFTLILDTLRLVPPIYDVTLAVKSIQSSLESQMHGQR